MYNELCQTQECGATNQIASFVISVTSHNFVHIIYRANSHRARDVGNIIIEFHWHTSLYMYTMYQIPFPRVLGSGARDYFSIRSIIMIVFFRKNTDKSVWLEALTPYPMAHSAAKTRTIAAIAV